MYLVSGIKIANENERFVVNTLGRYSEFKGPGLLYRLPGSATIWHRVSLGQEGVYLGDGLVKVNDAVFPIDQSEAYKTNDKIKIISFSSKLISVEKC